MHAMKKPSMRRALVLLLGVVSCASPDVRPVDGVPEDPGLKPPTLPMEPGPDHSPTTPGTSTLPNGSEVDAGTVDSEVPDDTTEDDVPPSTTAPTSTPSTPDNTSAPASATSGDVAETSAAEITSGAPVGVDGDAGLPWSSCDEWMEADAGMADAGGDAGSVSIGVGGCSGF